MPFNFDPKTDWTDYTFLEGSQDIAFHNGISDRLFKRVLAAMKTEYMGERSIDAVLKRYGSHWENKELRSKDQLFLADAVRFCRLAMAKEADKYLKITNKPDRLGLILAGAILYRLQPTIHTATTLLKFGLKFESQTLLRIALEQIGWAISASPITDDGVFAISATKSITKLTKIFPNSGKLYGHLSGMSHIGARNMRSIFEFQDGKIGVYFSNVHENLESLLALLHITDYYCATLEYISLDFRKKPRFFTSDTKGIKLNPNRPYIKTLTRYDHAVRKRLTNQPPARLSE